MRWIKAALITLACFSSLQAYDLDEAFEGNDEMLALDSEIGAMLEESELNEITFEESYQPEMERLSSPTKSSLPKIKIEEERDQSIPIEVDKMATQEESLTSLGAPLMETLAEEAAKSAKAIEISLRQVFSGSPIIYTLLFILSTVSVCVWLYSMLTIRSLDFLPPKLIKELRTKLISNQFDEALDLCVHQKHFFCKMLASGILSRKHGLGAMVDTMKSEGKRSTITFWQRINILNEIAIIAPMLGLLGTVLGMFYAFYDLNRSIESVSLLFDGLGISVGTTVAGLVVAILAMILHSIAKYRLVRILATVENEAQSFAALIDTRSASYLER